MKKILLLISSLIIILVGCTNNSSDVSETIEGEKDVTELLEVIYDDSFEKMTSEVYNFTQDYFKPLYIDKEGISITGYPEGMIKLRRAIENTRQYSNNLESEIVISEFENQDEVTNILQLQKDLINSAYDYVISFENWVIAEGEEKHKSALKEAYDSLTTYGMKGEEYTNIFEKYNFNKKPQIKTGLNIVDDSSYSENVIEDTENTVPTVPNDKPKSNPADYNREGEYKPVEDMTQEEIQAELEEMLKDSLGQ
jgi:hypothetical protein